MNLSGIGLGIFGITLGISGLVLGAVAISMRLSKLTGFPINSPKNWLKSCVKKKTGNSLNGIPTIIDT